MSASTNKFWSWIEGAGFVGSNDMVFFREAQVTTLCLGWKGLGVLNYFPCYCLFFFFPSFYFLDHRSVFCYNVPRNTFQLKRERGARMKWRYDARLLNDNRLHRKKAQGLSAQYWTQGPTCSLSANLQLIRIFTNRKSYPLRKCQSLLKLNWCVIEAQLWDDGLHL